MTSPQREELLREYVRDDEAFTGRVSQLVGDLHVISPIAILLSEIRNGGVRRRDRSPRATRRTGWRRATNGYRALQYVQDPEGTDVPPASYLATL